MSADTTQRQVSCPSHSDRKSLSEQLQSHRLTVVRLFVLDDAVGQSDDSPDFYINICQPLNPIPGVKCPAGAAVCMDPDVGEPMVGYYLVKKDHLR